jgi:transposase
VIDAILAEDKQAPPKQRHTAKRIFQRLKSEHGYGGGYTTVKDYVHEQKLAARETFVPLAHPPGHAQVDFGEAIGVIGGVRQKMHVFYMDLPHSDAPFMKAYPVETTEAFSMATCRRLRSLAAFRSRSFTTTRSWRSPRSVAMARASGRSRSRRC